MARFIRAIQTVPRKMDRPDKPGDDSDLLDELDLQMPIWRYWRTVAVKIAPL
jgi:hypothetical protein